MATSKISKVIINLAFEDKRQVSFTDVKFDVTEEQIKNFVNAVKQSFNAGFREAKKIVQEEILD